MTLVAEFTLSYMTEGHTDREGDGHLFDDKYGRMTLIPGTLL